MGFLVSPGIGITEVDQTNIVPATSTSVGGYAGHFNWGPVDELITVGSEKELATAYGSPTAGDTTRSFLTAASFLKYSNSLRVSRAIGLGAINAADSNPVLIKNKDYYDTLTGLDFVFSARYPGKLGNSIQVSYAHVGGNTTGAAYDNWEFKSIFVSPPNQSLTAQQAGISSHDEIHVVVVDRLGLITGTKGAVLETYEGLSLGSNAKNEDGGSIFYKDVINQTSSYVYVNTLTETFAQADTDINSASVFSVNPISTQSEASIELPFVLSVQTVITYSGGATETTTVNSAKTVSVNAGYIGLNGNNVKLNIRLLESSAAPAVAAHGYIKFGTPLNGDTVTVDGTTFTKAASASGSNFVTVADLVTLVGGLSGVTAVLVGTNVINIVAASVGVAGNTKTLVKGVNNAGTLSISGPTLRGGLPAASLLYNSVTIDMLSAVSGYVTYDVTVSTSTIVVGPVTKNTTSVSLADIINEVNYKATLLDNNDHEPLSFSVDGLPVTAASPIASMKLDIETILPYTASNQTKLNIYQFSGGEVVTYADNTLVNIYNLSDGADGAILPGNVVSALDQFRDKEIVDINLLFAEAFNVSQETVDTALIGITDYRKDIVGFISAPIAIANLTSNAAKKAELIAKFDAIPSTSYILFDETPVYTYNKYTDKYLWIPACGHTAGLCANADFVAEPWFSPAGFNRGQLKGVTKIAYNPNQADRDDLYKKRINSIVSIPGEGVVLIGDKTALSKPSAFDRVNVRRLFNVLERSIANAAKFQLFELNDEFTRASFKNTIEPFLRDVQGRRGLIDFRVICDETNNTPVIIDSNQFVGDIYLKPSRSINFIRLNFIATRTGVDFKELVGS